VQNAELRLSSLFTHKSAVVFTDAEGHFKVGRLWEWNPPILLVGDRPFEYSILVRADNMEYLGLSERGMGYTSASLYITCDLSRPVQTGHTQTYCLHMVIPSSSA
jgi:hypothetical protein